MRILLLLFLQIVQWVSDNLANLLYLDATQAIEWQLNAAWCLKCEGEHRVLVILENHEGDLAFQTLTPSTIHTWGAKVVAVEWSPQGGGTTYVLSVHKRLQGDSQKRFLTHYENRHYESSWGQQEP